MRINSYILFVWLVTSITGFSQSQRDTITIANGLKLVPLTENLYLHLSYFESTDFGRVPCNGLIYINGNEAIICDTPPNDNVSAQLLGWMNEKYPHVKAKALIVNHFHVDCLGGIREFHKAGVKSYAHELTPSLLKQKNDSSEVPQVLIKTSVDLSVGNKKITLFYPGEAHTKDNIVTWIPSENAIFGGCVVKTMNAGKGNIADANVAEWSNSVARIKSKFPSAKIVVPGHGNSGGTELLDYTIKLFRQ
jgi:metallo-beta-lactamase class B